MTNETPEETELMSNQQASLSVRHTADTGGSASSPPESRDESITSPPSTPRNELVQDPIGVERETLTTVGFVTVILAIAWWKVSKLVLE
jgi:hypothetical protein